MEEKTEEIRAKKVKKIRLMLAYWKRRIEEARDEREAAEMYRAGKDIICAVRDWESTVDPEGWQSNEADRAAGALWSFYRKKWLTK